MPLKTINNFIAPGLVGVLPKPKKKENNITFWRMFINVSEIVAVVGLDILSGGTASPLIGAGIGLVTAAANVGLDVSSTGTVSGINLGINLAAAFVPLGFAARAGVKNVAKVTTNAELLNTIAKNETKTIAENADKLFLRKIMSYKALKDADRAILEETIPMAQKIIEEGTGELTRVRTILKDLIETQAKGLSKGGKKLLNKAYTTKAFLKRELAIEDMKMLYSSISKTKAIFSDSVFKNSKRMLIKRMQSIAPNVKQGLLKSLFAKPISKEFSQARYAAKKMIEKIKFSIKDLAEQEIFDLIIEQRQFISNKMWAPVIDTYMANAKASFRNFVNEVTNGVDIKKIVNRFYGYTKFNTRSQIISFLSSRTFNDKYVQMIQLIDPNDAGRAIPERMYQFAKKRVDMWLAGKALSNTKRVVKAGSKKLVQSSVDSDKKVAAMFVESGGKLMPKNIYKGSKKVATTLGKTTAELKKVEESGLTIRVNRYIMGYKVLVPDPAGLRNLVLVKFNKATTESKSGKNIAGKRDIIVIMTDLDLELLALEGTDYWFRVGKRKGWFVSRGGRRIDPFGAISPEISFFLGFLPIGAIRFVGSAVSNVVENVSDITDGTYAKNWVAKFTRSLFRSSLNRPVRLITRSIIGGIAQNALGTTNMVQYGLLKGSPRLKAWFGNNVGRELQRIASIGLRSIEGQDKNGFFKFKKPSLKSLGRAYTGGILTAGRSNALRYSRRTFAPGLGERSYAAQMVSFRRNMNIARRIPSALTPQKVFSTKKFGRFKI